MTISSMTGFGRGQGRLSDGLAVGLTVRSVNHRYLDVQVRLSVREELPEVDAAVREEIARAVDRGRVAVQVNLQRLQPSDSTVVVDREGLREVLHQLRDVGEGDSAPTDVRVGDLLSVPGLVNVCSQSSGMSAEEIAALRLLLREVIGDFVAMRREEGGKLIDTIAADLATIRTFVDWFEPRQEEYRGAILQRLRQRMEELLDGVAVDEERLVHEAALLADKADVNEEVVRLRVHIGSFERRLAKGGVVGRALDFLCQELHRELNTLGTKCREAGIADRVVDAKGAVEKIREQVQNIE